MSARLTREFRVSDIDPRAFRAATLAIPSRWPGMTAVSPATAALVTALAGYRAARAPGCWRSATTRRYRNLGQRGGADRADVGFFAGHGCADRRGGGGIRPVFHNPDRV